MSTSTKVWVRKHPSPDTLSVRAATVPAWENASDWELLTEDAIAAWDKAEIEAGWVPVKADPPASELKAPIEDRVTAMEAEVEKLKAAAVKS